MHAYILLGGNKEDQLKKIESLGGGQKLLTFETSKIDQVRQLKKILSVKLDNTQIVLTGLDNASTDAQNALLKTLEEPADTISFFLCIARIANLLPTIISRCQLIRIEDTRSETDTKMAETFLSSNLGNKFAKIDTIRKREEAVGFLVDITIYIREKMHEAEDKTTWAKKLTAAHLTYKAVNQNANVFLALSNLCLAL